MKLLRPKTAAQSQAETTRMARRLFKAPAPRRILLPIAAFSAMQGFLLVYPRFDGPGVLAATLAFALPAYAAAGLTGPVADALGGRMYLRRSTLLAFLGLIVVGAVQLVAVAALTVYALLGSKTFDFPLDRIAVLGYGAAFWSRQVILASTSNADHARSLPAALVHPVLGIAGLALVAPLDPGELVLAGIVLAVFLGSAVAYAAIAKRPLLRSFGFDGLRLLRYTLDHYTEAEEAGVSELEGFFESISVPARIRLGGLAFRVAGRLRVVVLAPTAHPGPMGYVAGSDLPTKLATALADLTPDVMVAHGAGTHDENPATTGEVRKLGEAARSLLTSAPFARDVGQPVRVTRGRVTILAHAFGSSVLLVSSFAPNPTDDVDSATGHAAVQEAKLAGAQDAVFVDAHNCLEPGIGLTHFGSEGSHEILQASRDAAAAALRAPRGAPRVGYARRAGFCTPDQGLGARGIEALVVEVDGVRTAYVLFDGNNMVPGLRDEIRARLEGIVQEAEVLTTDNHSVNLTMTGFNAVGAAFDRGVLAGHAEAAVREALDGLEDAEAALVSSYVALRIFGPQAASRLTTSINATMAILRPALLITMSGALAAGALVLVLG